jgi:hypothetical protein
MPCQQDKYSENDIPDLKGYVVIVTGGKLQILAQDCPLGAKKLTALA